MGGDAHRHRPDRRPARDDALDTARLALFHPLTSMLASPVADEAEALSRMAPPVWVEDKYDGIRAQLHKQGAEVRLYSRELRDISDQFLEVVKSRLGQPWDGVLDGEVLGWRDGCRPRAPVPARRKAPSAGAGGRAGHLCRLRRAGAVDRRLREAEPLLRLPLRERRARSRTSASTTPTVRSRRPDHRRGCRGARVGVRVSAGPRQRRAHDQGPDGLRAGRRGYAWLKLKKALTTLDCVVVGVEVGHGRRHGVLSDYTFAVIDDRPGAPDGRW